MLLALYGHHGANRAVIRKLMRCDRMPNRTGDGWTHACDLREKATM